MPHLTQIAHLDFKCTEKFYLLPGKVIWYVVSLKEIVFMVWDYRANHSASFSLYIPHGSHSRLEVHFTLPKALKFASYSFIGK